MHEVTVEVAPEILTTGRLETLALFVRPALKAHGCPFSPRIMMFNVAPEL